MPKKFLISEAEARALAKLYKVRLGSDNLARPGNNIISHGNLPYRFKLKENMGATTANQANAAIYHFGGTTINLFDTDFVLDDSSLYSTAVTGMGGVCVYTTAYHILNFNSSIAAAEGTTLTDYFGLASTVYESTDLTVTLDNLEPINGVATTLTSLTAKNRFKWNIIDNALCYAKYNGHTSEHDLLQVECT